MAESIKKYKVAPVYLTLHFARPGTAYKSESPAHAGLYLASMGDAVNSESYTPRQRTRYRQRLIDDLEVFDRHLQQAEFIDQGTIGLELELNLVDMQRRRIGCA